jgi:competence protein ComEC
MAITAGLVCVSAFFSPQVELLAAASVLLLGLILRQSVLLSLGLMLIVSSSGSSSLEALRAPIPNQVSGVAQLMSDPEQQMFGTQLVISIDGRRYVATAPMEYSSLLRPLMMGGHIWVEGRATELQGAPEGWVKARHLAGRVQISAAKPASAASTPPWYQLANAIHRTLTAGADSFEQEQKSLYLGLVMGDDRGQSDLMRFRFQASGLSHLLAVSGQNVAFLLAVAAPFLRRLPQRAQVIAGGLLLVVFALVTRGEPSVLRAAVMAAIALASVASGRVVNGMRILSMTIIVLVLADPLLVHSIGFQLSICATAGLLLLTRPLAERLPGPGWLRLPLAVTLAAQAATAPVLIALAGGIPAVATPCNLLAVPAAGFVMMLGVTVGLFAGLVRNPVAQLVQIPSEYLVRWIEWVATKGSQSSLPLLRPPQLLLLGVAASLFLAVRSNRSKPASASHVRMEALRFVACCAAVALLVLAVRPVGPAAGELELADEATLWVGDCGGQVLVLGPVTNLGDLLEALWGSGIRNLDIVLVQSGSRAARSALPVAQQFHARQVLSVADRSPPWMSPIGADGWTVGGVQVSIAPSRTKKRANAPEPRVALLGSACSV